MAIPGTTTIQAYIAPNDERSTGFTHTEEWNRGGYRSVATEQDLATLLTTKRASKGMLVNVLATNTIKRLEPKQGFTYEDDNIAENWEFKTLSLGADVSALATKAELGDKLDTTQFESEKATLLYLIESEKANFATKDELANKVDKSDLTQIDLTQIKALLKAEILAELQQQAQQAPGAESGVS